MAFSKSWTTIADTEIDADSPLTVTLLTEIRDDLIYLKEYIGSSYTPAPDHNHDGTNSKTFGGNQFMLMDEETSTSSTSFVSVRDTRIYIPADLTTLTYTALVRVATTGTPDVRLNIGATNGSTISGTQDGASYNWTASEGTIDVSALSGWQTFNIQLKVNLGTVTGYVKTVFCILT